MDPEKYRKMTDECIASCIKIISEGDTETEEAHTAEPTFKYADENLVTLLTALGLNAGAIQMILNKPVKKKIPLWEKSLLTLEEASVYSGIGMNKLREMSNDENCTFVIWNQSKRLIKRKKLDEYLEKTYSI